MNGLFTKDRTHQGNKSQIAAQLAVFCVQWKLVHIIATFEMHKALVFPPGFLFNCSFISFRIVHMNWKGHDICENLKKWKNLCLGAD